MNASPRFQPTSITPSDEQLAIQTSPADTILVQANAGAAKTTTLALRIAQALASDVLPESILVLTYTKPAPRANMSCYTYPRKFSEQRGRYDDQPPTQGRDGG